MNLNYSFMGFSLWIHLIQKKCLFLHLYMVRYLNFNVCLAINQNLNFCFNLFSLCLYKLLDSQKMTIYGYTPTINFTYEMDSLKIFMIGGYDYPHSNRFNACKNQMRNLPQFLSLLINNQGLTRLEIEQHFEDKFHFLF